MTKISFKFINYILSINFTIFFFLDIQLFIFKKCITCLVVALYNSQVFKLSDFELLCHYLL